MEPAKDELLEYMTNSQKSRLWDIHQQPKDWRRAACGRYCTKQRIVPPTTRQKELVALTKTR